MRQSGDVSGMLGEILRQSMPERLKIGNSEARGVVLNLPEKRVARAMKRPANSACPVVMVKHGVLSNAGKLAESAFATLCRDLRVANLSYLRMS